MTPPRITVSMPLRQYRPEFLRKSLSSVFGQSGSQWELLVLLSKNAINPILRDCSRQSCRTDALH